MKVRKTGRVNAEMTGVSGFSMLSSNVGAKRSQKQAKVGTNDVTGVDQ